MIVEHVREYYARDSKAPRVDTGLLQNSIARTLPNPKHHALFAELVAGLDAEVSSPENVIEDYIGTRRATSGMKLAAVLAGGRPLPEVRSALEDYEDWLGAEDIDEKDREVLAAPSAVAIVEKRLQPGQLIRVLPLVLNNKLDGGLLRGQHMIVFARPEIGKTTFLVNATAGFLADGHKVLYVGNEDPMQDVVMRMIQRLSHSTRPEVIMDPQQADHLARQVGYDRLVLASLAPGSCREIEELVEEYEPDVLLVDQLRNIRVSKTDNFTQKLEAAASGLRQIGKRHKLAVVSVTQAGDSATGKSILDMGDVDSSNTGIPAQADVLLGIGASDEDFRIGRRVLSLPKNKTSGWHGSIPVQMNTAYFELI